MSTLTVRIRPNNPGDVLVQVKTYSYPGPSFDWKGVATTQKPVSETWNDMKPGRYCVVLRWFSGYQNIAATTEGNEISYNGANMYFQALGTPADPNGVLWMASFVL